MNRAALLAAWLLALSVAAGGAAAQDETSGAPQPDRSLRDPDFGVIARHIGLERRVEMLQWQATPRGYALVWSESPIDSSTFAPDHRNPGALPLQSRRWLARVVSIDGKPVDSEVIRKLGQWQDMRPSFSALPRNMAATFQPEGSGLGTADNPLQPHVGDLRVHWRDLVLPPLDDLVELRNGRWQLVPDQPGSGSAVADQASLSTSKPRGTWRWVAAGLFVLVTIGLLFLRRR